MNFVLTRTSASNISTFRQEKDSLLPKAGYLRAWLGMQKNNNLRQGTPQAYLWFTLDDYKHGNSWQIAPVTIAAEQGGGGQCAGKVPCVSDEQQSPSTNTHWAYICTPLPSTTPHARSRLWREMTDLWTNMGDCLFRWEDSRGIQAWDPQKVVGGWRRFWGRSAPQLRPQLRSAPLL